MLLSRRDNARVGEHGRVFLHIGMHKTGSTSIQAAFNGFRAEGVRYADLGNQNHSIPVWTAYSGAHQEYRIWHVEGLSPAEIDSRKTKCDALIRACFRAPVRDALILSGEDISLMPPQGVMELAEAIGHGTRPITVIVYVREAVSFCKSGLQEQIKAGATTAELYPPTYRFRIEKFQQVFGAENVIVREFAAEKLVGGDVVEDFARIIGVSPPSRRIETNTSLSTEAARVLFLMNHFVSAQWERAQVLDARERMIDHLRLLFPGRFAIPQELVRGVVDLADTLWLKEATGVDFTSSIEQDGGGYDPEALRLFLAQVSPETLETIRSHLSVNCDVRAPPQEPYFLLARYFMSFLTG